MTGGHQRNSKEVRAEQKLEEVRATHVKKGEAVKALK